MNNTISKIGLVCISIALLSACSTSKDLLPTDNQTMKAIWDQSGSQHQLLSYRNQDNRPLDPVDYIAAQKQISYTRTAENEVNNLFPRLSNPDLVMYIYPHLSKSGEPMPVPGYSTVIPFYSRTQYAQPGERVGGL